MSELAVYAGLFLVALATATILPMQSEAALAGRWLQGTRHGCSSQSQALATCLAPS